MIIEQGMGTKLRDQVFHEDNGGMVFDKMTHDRPYSDDTAKQIDDEIKVLMQEAAGRAEAVLKHNRKHLDALAEALLKHETLEEEAVEEVLKETSLPKEAVLHGA